MRIIGGKLKNKKLHFPKNLKTRPLKDSVRENIFNILSHSNNIGINIKKSAILDLYAGTGSFGFECISREASEVIFVENDLDALTSLEKNIKNLNPQNKKVWHKKYFLTPLQKYVHLEFTFYSYSYGSYILRTFRFK